MVRWLFRSSFLAMLALGACFQQDSVRSEYSYLHTVPVLPSDTLKETEQHYGGDVLLWRPDESMAVLGYKDEGDLFLLDVEPDPNIGALSVPGVSASSLSWASRYDAWGGGWSAWTAEDSSLTTFQENLIYWEKIKLAKGQRLAPNLGAGVKVAIIDTGLDLYHPALKDNLTSDNEWRDFVDDDNVPQEEPGTHLGHGTSVAGIILQVAPEVTLLPIRALGVDGTGDLIDVVRAIDWAMLMGADIINLSLGSNADLKTLKEMLKLAKKKELVIVASVGNQGDNEVEFPARYKKEVVNVGSVDRDDVKSSFSSYGKNLEVFAPGEDLYSLAPDSQIAVWSGTSFAAPIVTGAVALALGEADDKKVKVKELDKYISETAEDISKRRGNQGYKKEELGKGRLNIAAFLEKAVED